MNKNNAKYGIFHDLPKASPIKIHINTCSFFQIHDPTAPTTNWFYTSTLETATKIAKKLAIEHKMQYRDCKFCKPSTL